MKKAFLSFFLIITLAGLFLPLATQAAGLYQTKEGAPICYEGLVPCGKNKPYWINGSIVDGKCHGTKIEEGMACQFCHFFIMFGGIVDFVLKLITIVAVLMIVIGGIMLLTSAGNPDNINRAKNLLKSVIIGLIIIFAAWLIVNLFFLAIGVAEPTGLREGWFIIECPIEIP